MIERIRQIWSEVAWLLTEITGSDFDIEQALVRLQAALDDLEAVDTPSDDQIEVVFLTLATLQSKLLDSLVRVPKQNQSLVENLTDRIELFLFHHRM
ncbi:hypothetical protein [Spirosoma arcticum]